MDFWLHSMVALNDFVSGLRSVIGNISCRNCEKRWPLIFSTFGVKILHHGLNSDSTVDALTRRYRKIFFSIKLSFDFIINFIRIEFFRSPQIKNASLVIPVLLTFSEIEIGNGVSEIGWKIFLQFPRSCSIFPSIVLIPYVSKGCN